MRKMQFLKQITPRVCACVAYLILQTTTAFGDTIVWVGSDINQSQGMRESLQIFALPRPEEATPSVISELDDLAQILHCGSDALTLLNADGEVLSIDTTDGIIGREFGTNFGHHTDVQRAMAYAQDQNQVTYVITTYTNGEPIESVLWVASARNGPQSIFQTTEQVHYLSQVSQDVYDMHTNQGSMRYDANTQEVTFLENTESDDLSDLQLFQDDFSFWSVFDDGAGVSRILVKAGLSGEAVFEHIPDGGFSIVRDFNPQTGKFLFVNESGRSDQPISLYEADIKTGEVDLIHSRNFIGTACYMDAAFNR